jgi:antitoxin component of RelBE/YafQ-DinJ toxin-antitoxin module
MQQDETTHKLPASALKRVLNETLTGPSHQKVATVLERAIAPDMLPVTLQVDDQEVETVQYIAELAAIAHHHSAPTHTDGIKWRTRSHRTWEI